MLSNSQLFDWAGQLAMLGWFTLVFLPRRWQLLNWVPGYIIPLALSLLYAGLILANFFTVEGGGYSSLAKVRALFSQEELLLAGWVHYLAFDLFVGAWIARSADEIGLSRLFQAPIFAATLMFGPVGLALFLLIRLHFTRDIKAMS
ncbi:MAG: ABA4-like family protein [Pseudomonadota bacterium]